MKANLSSPLYYPPFSVFVEIQNQLKSLIHPDFLSSSRRFDIDLNLTFLLLSQMHHLRISKVYILVFSVSLIPLNGKTPGAQACIALRPTLWMEPAVSPLIFSESLTLITSSGQPVNPSMFKLCSCLVPTPSPRTHLRVIRKGF